MIFNPYKISENFVLKKLKTINSGKLILQNYNGKYYNFGELNSSFEVKIKIHNPKFYFNILRGGSNALAESYIKNDFVTPNLPSLIELTAKNIEVTQVASLTTMMLSAFLIGLGTAIGSGCTSGHGICGLARLSVRSLIAVITFLFTAVATVYFFK